MIIEYEVEEQLPFSINEAIIDFIVTSQSNDGMSQVLVAAIRDKDLQEILDIYNKAGIAPTNICVDLFSIYNTYQLIPSYKSIADGTSIVDVGNYSTRITFIQNGALRLVRNIPKGLATIAEAIAEESGMSQEALILELKSKSISSIGSLSK